MQQLELPIVSQSGISATVRKVDGMVCGASNRAVAVAVVVREIGCQRVVLVVKRSEGDDKCPRWVFPGGKIEAGESARAAAKRELREETGVVANRPLILGHRKHPVSGVEIFYVAFRSISNDRTYSEEDKIEAVEWIPTSAIYDKLGSSIFEGVSSYLFPRQGNFAL